MAAHIHREVSIGPLKNLSLVTWFLVFTGITVFNALELIVTCLLTFRRRSSVYFWAILIASTGAIFYEFGNYFLIMGSNPSQIGPLISIDIGWVCMVTGQSVVQWSRLHLICHSKFKLRAVLAMIVVNALVLHTTEITFTFLAVKNGQLQATNKNFARSEKIGVCIFSTQEFLISCMYIYEAIKKLRVGSMLGKKKPQQVLWKLFATNVFIILLDVALLGLEFGALWGIWDPFKGLVYTVKLKIEFVVLNQLKTSVQKSRSQQSGSSFSEQQTARRRTGVMNLDDKAHDFELQSGISRSRMDSSRASQSNKHSIFSSVCANKDPSPPSSGPVDDCIIKSTEITRQEIPAITTPKPAMTTRRGSEDEEIESLSEISFASRGA